MSALGTQGRRPFVQLAHAPAGRPSEEKVPTKELRRVRGVMIVRRVADPASRAHYPTATLTRQQASVLCCSQQTKKMTPLELQATNASEKRMRKTDALIRSVLKSKSKRSRW